MIDYRTGDVFTVELKRASFALVYADPPYANCRFHYARQNKSRQWGRNARADYIRTLIARMDWLRAEDGICALSMGSPELRLLHLFPSTSRVLAWVKPFAPNRPGVWPTYATEYLITWGCSVSRLEQKQAKATPKDWLLLAPAVPKAGDHENPKPDAFGDWILDVTLGPRSGAVLELFAGTYPISRAADRRGLNAVAIDFVNWLERDTPLLVVGGDAA